MGTVKTPKLSNEEIVSRYRGGEGRGMIGLRAGLTDTRIQEILLAAGVPLRDRAEARILNGIARRRRRG